MSKNIKVMMTTEGTYPFHHGGVSTWCDALIKGLQNDIDFVMYSIIMNPYVTQKFDLPNNVDLIKVPLWGTEEPSEHLNIPFSKVYIAKKRTVDKVVQEQFIPLFIDMIEEIISSEKDPKKFGDTLHKLYMYFSEYEYKKSFKSEITWDVYKRYILDFAKKKENDIPFPGVFSIIQSLGWIYRFMTILNTPLPKVDITHSAAAAFCGIPCVLAKLHNNTPYILTEHGVYLREQYLSLSMREYPSFLNTFLIRLIHSVVSLNYYYADQISPVCGYNTRWEEQFGVAKEKISIIYNGVDKNVFTPDLNAVQKDYTTVVSVARIDPVKDIVTLLKAAAIVKKQAPETKFVVYGSVTVPEYYEECLRLRRELQLVENFTFAGHTNDITAAYHSGDIIALSSITEAFPYSVVEAMMTGKAVIATDVGGIKEALGECGILVPPRNEEALSKGIIALIRDNELRIALSEAGRERALNYFTIERAQQSYYQSYLKLYVPENQVIAREADVLRNYTSKSKKKQELFMEKAAALMELGYYAETIIQLRLALQEEPNSPAIPYILSKIADAYNKSGEYDNAFYELERIEAYIALINKMQLA